MRTSSIASLPQNKYLREFFNYVETHPDEFKLQAGDNNYDDVVVVRRQQQHLTKVYISKIAAHENTDSVNRPALYVLSRKPHWEEPSFSNRFSNRDPPSTKLTHLRLVDGDGNQMLGRLPPDISSTSLMKLMKGANPSSK